MKNNVIIKRLLRKLIKIPRVIEIFLIDIYKKYISNSFGKRCIYYPSCSTYVRQAVDKYGIIKGNLIGIKRLIKCNPFSNGGIDYLKWKGAFKW